MISALRTATAHYFAPKLSSGIRRSARVPSVYRTMSSDATSTSASTTASKPDSAATARKKINVTVVSDVV